MRHARALTAALCLSAPLAAGLVGPAAAQAAPVGLPIASLSDIVDVGELVKKLFEAIGDIAVPDAMKDNQWGAELVSWMVSIPQVTSTRHFPELNDFRRDLSQGIAFGILSLTFAAASLQYLAGGFTGSFTAVDVFKRAIVATGAIAFYAKIMGLAVVGTNTLTTAILAHENVSDGVNKAIVGVFALTFFTGGAGLGLGLAALMTCLYFLAAIFVMKIGLTAGLAILAVCGPIVLALYPLPAFAWLPKLWGAALVAVLSIPIAWALVFAVAAVTTSDALLLGDGLGSSLEGLVKPFVAVACFYVAFKAPGFMLACARTLGFNANGFAPPSMSGRGGGGAAAGGGGFTGGRIGGAQWMKQTNADRMRGLYSAVAKPRAQRAAANVLSKASVVGGSMAVAAAPPGTRRAAAFNAAASGSRKVSAVGGAMKRENDWWKALPEQSRIAKAASAAGHNTSDGASAGAGRSRGDRHSSATPGNHTTKKPAASRGATAPRPAAAPTGTSAPTSSRSAHPHTSTTGRPATSTTSSGPKSAAGKSGRPASPTSRPSSGSVVAGAANTPTTSKASASRPATPSPAPPSGPATTGVGTPPSKPPTTTSKPSRPASSPLPARSTPTPPRSRPAAPTDSDTPTPRKRRPKA